MISGVDRYRCASLTNGRGHLCTNSLTVSRHVVESKLLESLKSDLLSPEVIADVVKRVRDAVAAAEQTSPAESSKIATLRGEIERLVDAVASGLLAPSPAVRARQERAEAELARMDAARDAPAEKVERLLPKIAESYRAIVSDIATIAQRDVARAHADLRRVLGDSIRLLPSEGGDFLEAEVTLEGEKLVRLAGNSLKNQGRNNVVAGSCFGNYSHRVPLR